MTAKSAIGPKGLTAYQYQTTVDRASLRQTSSGATKIERVSSGQGFIMPRWAEPRGIL